MKAPEGNPNITKIQYPCYLLPLTDLPVVELVDFDNVLLAYDNNGKYLCFDCIPSLDWKAKVCKLTYEERLTNLRYTLSEIGNYKKYIDLQSWRVSNPAELVDIYKSILTMGHKGAKIIYENGLYCFDVAANGEYWELVPRKVEIE